MQIYSPDGRYLGGWFVYHHRPFRVSHVNFFYFPLNDPDRVSSSGQESVLVYLQSDETIIRYDLNGRVIGEKKEKLTDQDLSQARPEPGRHHVPWYKCPLTEAFSAAILALIGFIVVWFHAKHVEESHYRHTR